MIKYPRIGNQTSYTSVNILEPFEYAITNGFDAFEWFPDRKEDGRGWLFKDIDNDTRGYIRSKAIENDIQMAVHVPWYIDPVIEDTHHLLEETIRFALDTGSSLINIHLTTPDVRTFVSSIKPFLNDACGSGLMVSIENTVYTGPDKFNELFRIISSTYGIDKDKIGMCLDIGHANLHNQYRNNYLGYIRALDPALPLIHIHMHENYGDDDTHMTVFTGPSMKDDSGIRNIVEMLILRRFMGAIILEQWPEPRKLLKDARSRLLKIWSDIVKEKGGGTG